MGQAAIVRALLRSGADPSATARRRRFHLRKHEVSAPAPRWTVLEGVLDLFACFFKCFAIVVHMPLLIISPHAYAIPLWVALMPKRPHRGSLPLSLLLLALPEQARCELLPLFVLLSSMPSPAIHDTPTADDCALALVMPGDTPLHAAIRGKHLAASKALLADPRVSPSAGAPLLAAVRVQSASLVSELLRAGASPSTCGTDVARLTRDNYERKRASPLQLAMTLGADGCVNFPSRLCVVRALLAGGADANEPVRRACSPLDFAIECKWPLVQGALWMYGGRQHPCRAPQLADAVG